MHYSFLAAANINILYIVLWADKVGMGLCCPSQGNPPGLIGLSAAHAVTFIDNHDTGSTLQHWPFPRSHLQEGYSYILSHPGTPCVFYDDLHDASCGPIVRQLMRMRRRNKLHAQSQVKPLSQCQNYNSSDCSPLFF
jgi:hypothetical protein